MNSPRSNEALLSDIVAKRLSRRKLLKNAAFLAAVQVVGSRLLLASSPKSAGKIPKSSLTFPEIQRGRDEKLHVAKGYEAQTLLRWGDPLHADSPPFSPLKQNADDQRRQFGYNCDYVGFLPLPFGSRNSGHGLLGVNHEYTTLHNMQPGRTKKPTVDGKGVSKEEFDIELAAQGFSVVEIKRENGRWKTVLDSPHNRRIDMGKSRLEIRGPARGHPRMQSKTDDSQGCEVIGTFSNCAGGMTPWGTFLSAEENFQDYFYGVSKDPREERNQLRHEINKDDYYYRQFDSRFDAAKDPREANRFGWVVEIDPYQPDKPAVKRTALGRFRHEAANCVINSDGRVVVYSGDDQKGEYLYRFVTAGRFDPKSRAANLNLLDEGELSVARFDADGGLCWLPLVFGQGPLNKANGFSSQADVVIEARSAADFLGATRMDRPEDVEVNPVTGLVYVVLTNNSRRGVDFPLDAANPREKNPHGHILELHAPISKGHRDHAAGKMHWDMFIRAGDPQNPQHGADYQESLVSDSGWLSCPDNVAFDGRGRLWIATDGAKHSADGVYACDTQGPGRALTKLFMRSPRGAEVCGPCFTPDDTTFFCAIQHPGVGKEFHFAQPSTRWPDFEDGMPTRPSVVAITRKDGGIVGD
ncbi:MAG: PhoX family phosphatase [Planctomycetota bacterium]